MTRLNQTPIRVLLCFLLVTAAAWRLGNEFPRLLFEENTWAAQDLRVFYTASRAWFQNAPFYGIHPQWDYPPASYAAFWALVGWADFSTARWIWALTTLAALIGFAWIFQAQSGLSTVTDRCLFILFPLACYFPSAAIAVGQPSVHLIFAIAFCALLLFPESRSWGRDLTAACLLLFTLLKPTMGAPFIILVGILPRRFHVGLLASVGYLFISFVAAFFRSESLQTLVMQWFNVTQSWGNYAAGHANLSRFLTLASLEAFRLPATLATLGVLSVWLWRHRQANLWLLVAVTGLVTRLSIHHRLHDDGLVIFSLLPLLSLTRIDLEKQRIGSPAGILLWLTAGSLLFPAQFFHQEIWQRWILEGVQVLIWTTTLVFLMRDGPRRLGQV